MLQIRSKLLYNQRVQGGFFRLVARAAGMIREAAPGKFVDIRIDDGYGPLLRRPFSIHRVREQNIEVIYEVLGKGTEVLSRKKPGEYLDIIGPLGNGYSILDVRYSILIAGGMGVAPLIFLTEKLAKRKTQNAKRKIIVLIGAKTKNEILCAKEFTRLGCDVKISTDDGSRGFKGKVTDLLKKILPFVICHKRLAIYACGPRPMLKEVSRVSTTYKIPAQISLEEHLACGIGACLGCVVNTKEGFKRVCKEGPVFNAEEIIWPDC